MPYLTPADEVMVVVIVMIEVLTVGVLMVGIIVMAGVLTCPAMVGMSIDCLI